MCHSRRGGLGAGGDLQDWLSLCLALEGVSRYRGAGGGEGGRGGRPQATTDLPWLSGLGLAHGLH